MLTEHGVDRACPPRGCAEGVSFLTAAAAPLPRDYATPLGGFFIESAALGSESDWAFGHVSFGPESDWALSHVSFGRGRERLGVSRALRLERE